MAAERAGIAAAVVGGRCGGARKGLGVVAVVGERCDFAVGGESADGNVFALRARSSGSGRCVVLDSRCSLVEDEAGFLLTAVKARNDS